ncbi:hypothetical protein NA56DRAFT_648505 [Hyaloscypha hepaticicola]|uniref:Uncharacterized protein n=1 Tax=Hyaloscypha hepaticicola TaxID=2082293 RepID=A0A2J6PTT7_9HELO|nr:hypothetical protein NA56DRAFT_648505 [Hyaloscypha hepaticicola]
MFSLGDNKQQRRTFAEISSKKTQFAIFPDVPEHCPRNPSGAYSTGTGPPHCTKRGLCTSSTRHFEITHGNQISGRLLLTPALFVVAYTSLDVFHKESAENIGTRRLSQNDRESVAKSEIENQGTSSSHQTPPQPRLAFESLHITSSIPQTYSRKLSRARQYSIRLPALKFQHSAFYDVVPLPFYTDSHLKLPLRQVVHPIPTLS